jgi:hypothetical protein
MVEIITHIIDIALPAILGYLAWLLKEERKERKANTLGMKEILGYMIDRWYEEFMLQGYITTDQRNTFEGVYKAYAANKGNGARAAKWVEIQKLHIDDTKSSASLYLQMVMEQKKCQEKEGSSK